MDRRGVLKAIAGVGAALLVPGRAAQDEADDITERLRLGITRPAIWRSGFRDCTYCLGAGTVLNGVNDTPGGPYAEFKRCPACAHRRAAHV